MIRNLPQGHPNGTWTFYDWQSSRQSILDRFTEVARRFPDRPATYDTARQLTYVELERAANGAAHAILEARGPNQEAVIILTGINTTATIAALGVLKANKFYVGLDPGFPAVRAGQIIQDTEAKLILTETLHLPLLQMGLHHDKVLNYKEKVQIEGSCNGACSRFSAPFFLSKEIVAAGPFTHPQPGL